MILRQDLIRQLTRFLRWAAFTAALVFLPMSPRMVGAAPLNTPKSEQLKDADDVAEADEETKPIEKPELPNRGIFKLTITTRGTTQETENLRRALSRLRRLTTSNRDN